MSDPTYQALLAESLRPLPPRKPPLPPPPLDLRTKRERNKAARAAAQGPKSQAVLDMEAIWVAAILAEAERLRLPALMTSTEAATIVNNLASNPVKRSTLVERCEWVNNSNTFCLLTAETIAPYLVRRGVRMKP